MGIVAEDFLQMHSKCHTRDGVWHLAHLREGINYSKMKITSLCFSMRKTWFFKVGSHHFVYHLSLRQGKICFILCSGDIYCKAAHDPMWQLINYLIFEICLSFYFCQKQKGPQIPAFWLFTIPSVFCMGLCWPLGGPRIFFFGVTKEVVITSVKLFTSELWSMYKKHFCILSCSLHSNPAFILTKRTLKLKEF